MVLGLKECTTAGERKRAGVCWNNVGGRRTVGRRQSPGKHPDRMSCREISAPAGECELKLKARRRTGIMEMYYLRAGK